MVQICKICRTTDDNFATSSVKKRKNVLYQHLYIAFDPKNRNLTYLHKLLRGEWHNVANKSEGSRVRKA